MRGALVLLAINGAGALTTGTGLASHIDKIQEQHLSPKNEVSPQAAATTNVVTSNAEKEARSPDEKEARLADQIADKVLQTMFVHKMDIPNALSCPSTFTASAECCSTPTCLLKDGCKCGIEYTDIGWDDCMRTKCNDFQSSGPKYTYIPGQNTTIDQSTQGSASCFAKDVSTACLFSSAVSECERVLMADLIPGDLVLGRDGATTVVAVQHKAADTNAEMLTFHMANGQSVSMTADHGIFADSVLIAAADVKVGSVLSVGTVSRITKREAATINAVTVSGTIVADGVLAASNPIWIASVTVDAPLTRAVVNVILYAGGDVDSMSAGFVKVAGMLTGAILTAKALRTQKVSA